MSSAGSLGSQPERPTTPPLPTGALPLSHQIAGHRHGQGKTKLGEWNDVFCDNAIIDSLNTLNCLFDFEICLNQRGRLAD